MAEVQDRAREFIQEVKDKYPEKTIVLCSHGDFLRMVISVLLNKTIEEADSSYRMDNGSYSIFDFSNGSWEMVAFSLLPHGE
jgi:broad specificity phosphatase PhoE